MLTEKLSLQNNSDIYVAFQGSAMALQSFGSDFVITKKLGEGSFSEVFEVTSKSTGKKYAVKRMKKHYKSLEEVKQLPEITALTALQGNDFVVKLIDIMFDFDAGSLAIVFEKLDLNLYEYLCELGQPMSEESSLLVTFQILLALKAMHDMNIFHRDIKPENCMIDRNTLAVKLVDFGSTRSADTRGPYTEYVSTRWYRAPECILTSGSYGPAVDVWAVGCMLYELLMNRPLFPGKQEIDQINRIHAILGSPSREVVKMFKHNPNTQIEYLFPLRRKQNLRNFLPGVSGGTVDLIENLLIYNPLDRITVDQALEHPVFSGMHRAYDMYIRMRPNIPYSLFYINGPPPPPQSQPVMPSKPIIEQLPEEQPTSKTTKPKVQLLSTRKAAAERIKQYNKMHPKISNNLNKSTIVAPKGKKQNAQMTTHPYLMKRVSQMNPLSISALR